MPKVQFKNAEGYTLSARVESPLDQPPKAMVLFAHCFTCSKNLNAVRHISREFTAHGFGIMRFDFTGLGESEGEFEDTNFSSNVSDLIDAAAYLGEHYLPPDILVGHSLGGAAVIFAAAQLKSVQAVATVGAPADTEHVKHLFSESLEEIRSAGKAKVNIGSRPFLIKDQFVQDLERNDLPNTLKSLRKPILFMHSPQDRVVDVENARKLYNAAMHPKSFISLDGADHLLSSEDDACYVGQAIAAWATRYVEFKEREDRAPRKRVAVRIGTEKYTTEVRAGNHQITADEPKSVGGDDLGPTPYDLLTASLGTCISMTLRMYADRKGWPLKSVEVHLNHGKDYPTDCDNCEDPAAKVDRIDTEILLVGDLDDTQRKRLMEIAGKCPVHKTLLGDIEIHKTEIETSSANP